MGIFSNLFNNTEKNKLLEVIKAGALLVDVRTPSEYASGHVKGSVNIPLDTISRQLTKFKNRQGIVVFCQSGNRSRQAISILHQFGIDAVLDGGSWSSIQQIVTKINNQL